MTFKKPPPHYSSPPMDLQVTPHLPWTFKLLLTSHGPSYTQSLSPADQLYTVVSLIKHPYHLNPPMNLLNAETLFYSTFLMQIDKTKPIHHQLNRILYPTLPLKILKSHSYYLQLLLLTPMTFKTSSSHYLQVHDPFSVISLTVYTPP